MRARDTVLCALVVCYAIMWIGGLATLGRAQPDWAAPLFLMLAGAVAGVAAADARAVVLFAAGGLAVELVGVHTGLPFGRYEYTNRLGPALFGVPVAIAGAWTSLLLLAREVARNRLFAGAALMTAIDLLVDPVASRVLGYWEWRQAGFWFGVPLINFAGWFVVSAALLASAGPPQRPSRVIMAIGISILVFLAASAAGFSA
jgi:uncharacterized membrane protein